MPSGYHYPEVENIFMNISAKTKIFFKNIIGCDSRDNILPIHEKTRLQKSHASVPIRKRNHDYLCLQINGCRMISAFMKQPLLANNSMKFKTLRKQLGTYPYFTVQVSCKLLKKKYGIAVCNFFKTLLSLFLLPL